MPLYMSHYAYSGETWSLSQNRIQDLRGSDEKKYVVIVLVHSHADRDVTFIYSRGKSALALFPQK